MNKFLKILGLVVVVILIYFLLGWFVMLLWNWLMPMIFGLTTLGYWESWGLLVLCGLLFKSTHTNKQ